MSAQSEIVGNAGSPHVFTHGGKKYTLRLIDDSLNVEWERKQLARAREFEAGNRGILSRDEYMDRLDRLSERYHAGEFSLFRWLVKNQSIIGQAKSDQKGLADRLIANPEVAHNFILLFSLIFGCEELEMMKMLAEAGPEVASYVNLIVKESMPTGVKAETNGDGRPNA